MSNDDTAGRPTSVRLPHGLAEELRAATGRPVGEIARELLLAYRETLRKERVKKEQATNG